MLVFFPPADRDQLQIELNLSPSAAIEITESEAMKAREILLNHSEIKEVYWFLGRSAPVFYYNVKGNKKNAPLYAHAIVQLNSIPNKELINNLQKELDEAFPKAQVIVRQLEQGPPVTAPIEIRISGNNLNVLQELGEKIQVKLEKNQQVTHTIATLSKVLPKVKLKLNEEEGKIAGLNNREIAQQLNGYLVGYLGGSVIEDTEELPIRVRLSRENRHSLEQIASLHLVPQNNRESKIPLSVLGEIY